MDCREFTELMLQEEEMENFIEGDFKSDENFIYLKGAYVKENYYYGDYDNVKKK